MLSAIHAGEAEVIGATTWLWTREDFRDSVDVLVVDEAGQMSLANVLAAAHAAPNLILLGDPQQLGQPSAAAHPPGAGVSALERVLGDNVTMPEDRGLFIDHTRRMHPAVCAFTSEVFYENRLASLDELRNQTILGDGQMSGTGLRVVDVSHEGNDNSSPEEAQVVAELVAELHTKQWRNAAGDLAVIGLEGILIVTPFNAQVREIEAALARPRHHRCAGGHSRQVPRTTGAGCHLLDGVIDGRGRTEGNGVPLRPAATERGDVAGTLPGDPRFQP